MNDDQKTVFNDVVEAIEKEINKTEEKDRDFFGGKNETPSRDELSKIIKVTKDYFIDVYPL